MISIIIPLYNREELIKETLESILGQTDADWECIIVDDGSTDNSLQVAREYTLQDKRIKVFQRPETHIAGGNGARNFGVQKATGSFICWFDSDDLFYPDYIRNMSEAIKNNPGKDAFICDINWFERESQNIIRSVRYSENDSFFLNQITEKKKVYFPNILIKKHIAESNPLIEELANSQDYVYFTKLLMFVSPVIVNKSLINIRIHSNNISGNNHSVQYVKNQCKATSLIFTHIQNAGFFNTDALAHLFYRNIVDLRKALLNKSEELSNEIRATIFNEYFTFLRYVPFMKLFFNLENFTIKHVARPLKIAPRTWFKLSALLYSKLVKSN